MVAIGQIFRSLAMIQAADNFAHQISTNKAPEHKLVTQGVYSLSRHPSYFGFFYWSIGTQVLLGNPISAVLFTFILWRFFHRRIQREEVYLVKFFGKDYEDYRKKVSVGIPLLR
jgi:protein-S-isoprenylcysteine O-methyltransferase